MLKTIRGYEILSEIGAGGFGSVYRAYQPIIEREVAIKVITARVANQLNFVRNFESEARLIARLEHPHIVPLFDYWRDPEGAYLVQRLLRGGSLAEVVKKGRLPIATVVRMMEQITDALAIAHRQNIVHRDIKPANILLDEEGNAYLADFGIATLAGTGDDGDELVGSLSYMAPELLQGEPPSIQTDIYSLGIALYELATGVHPFEHADTTQLITFQLKEPVPDPLRVYPDLPVGLNLIIQRATAKDPASRYPDVHALATDLRDLLNLKKKTAVMQLVHRNPYKGLRAFDEADAVDFFGRETLVEAMLERMRQERFLAVVGPSGSGKSSVVRAGLLPALRQGRLPGSEHWFIGQMIPGANPLEKLISVLSSVAMNLPPDALTKAGDDPYGLLLVIDQVLSQLGEESKLVIFIDQFEEVFTLVENEQERKFFLNILHTALMSGSNKLRVIITIRADFYDRPLLYEDIGALVQSRTQVVLPLGANEIERAITGPAEQVGLQVDADLIAQIVADVREEPGALPLLQYALTEVYERREGDRLTVGAYTSSGGVLGALARRAEEVYKGLVPAQRELARQIFLRLVALGEGTEDTRRRARLQELIVLSPEKNAIQDVLDIFGKYRLLTFDREPMSREPTVDVAHEALIRTWERLHGWLNDSRNDIRLQRLLANAAQEWADTQRQAEFLLHGGRLAQFEDWLKTISISLTPLERDFLEASIARRLELEAQEHERQAREIALQKRARRFLVGLAAVLSLGVIISLLLAGLIFRQSEETAQARDVAEQNAAEAQSLVLAANAQQAFNAGNPDLAVALALASTNSPHLPTEAFRTLVQIAYAPGTSRVLPTQDAPVRSIAVSADGRYYLTGVGRLRLVDDIAEDNSLILWDAATGEALHRLEGHTDSVLDATFSPDGTLVASTGRDGQLILWDIATGEEVRRITLNHPAPYVFAAMVAFTPDGEQLLTAGTAFESASFQDWNEALLMPPTLWEVASGEQVKTFTFEPEIKAILGEIGILPDGSTAIINSWNFRPRTYEWLPIQFDLATGEEIQRFSPTHAADLSPFYTTMALNHAGTRLAVTKSDGAGVLQLFNVEDGSSLTIVNGGVALDVGALVFSPDDYQLLVGTGTNSVHLLDAQTLNLLRTFNGHEATILSAGFTPDGRSALSGAADGSIRLWSLETQAQLQQFMAHTAQVSVITTSPDGTLALSAQGGSETIFRPEENSTLVWNPTTQTVLHELEGLIFPTLTVGISPDQQIALTGGAASLPLNGIITLWDLETGAEIRRIELEDPLTMVVNATFTADGDSIIAALYNGSVVEYEVATGAEKRVIIPPSEGGLAGFNALALSPDNGTFLNNFNRGELALYDLATGEQLAILSESADVAKIVYSPNGETALVILNDNTFALWDIATRTRLRRFVGHTATVTSAAFTPDGTQIISSSADNTLILWDALTGSALQSFEGHGDDVLDVAVIGQQALSAGKDGTVITWNIAPPSLEEVIAWTYANRYVRPLTAQECLQYRIETGCAEG